MPPQDTSHRLPAQTAGPDAAAAIVTPGVIFAQPVFATPTFVGSVDIPEQSAKRLVRAARDGGLLREVRAGRGRRATIFCFPELLEIVEGRPVFADHG